MKELDYSKFSEFPFPSVLSEQEKEAKKYFFSLPDGEQLALLNGSGSYGEFLTRVKKRMEPVQTA